MEFNTPSLRKFWNDLPLIASLVIAASILMYLGWLVDHSFMNLAVPGLDGIRNGRYLGLITSSLFENSVLFLGWGVGWIWYFGKSIENSISLPFSVFLIISSIVFPELFEILIFETAGYGMGGICFSIFGFIWIMSVNDPAKWSVSRAERWIALAFIFLCIIVDYVGVLKIGIAGLVGGLIWGVFVGFVYWSIEIKALRFAIPAFVLGLFLVPVFWAPWQVSWLLYEAEKYSRQHQLVKEREFLSRALKKDPENEQAKKVTHILDLFEESQKHSNQGDFEKAKESLLQILEISPEDQNIKGDLKINELQQDYEKYYEQQDFDKAASALSQILEINPDAQDAKQALKIIQLYRDYLKYFEQQDLDKAESALSQILEIRPDDENTKKNLQGVRLWKAFFAYRKDKDFDKAKDALSQILAIEPNNGEAKTYLKEIESQAKKKGV